MIRLKDLLEIIDLDSEVTIKLYEYESAIFSGKLDDFPFGWYKTYDDWKVEYIENTDLGIVIEITEDKLAMYDEV